MGPTLSYSIGQQSLPLCLWAWPLLWFRFGFGPGTHSMHGMGACPDKHLTEMESASVIDAWHTVEWQSLAPHPAPKSTVSAVLGFQISEVKLKPTPAF